MSWRHAITWVKSRYGEFDLFVSLPATSPLRSVQDVENAVNKLSMKKADICISVTPANRSPYFNQVELDQNGSPSLIKSPATNVARRQDSPKVYDITTVVYVANVLLSCKLSWKKYGKII